MLPKILHQIWLGPQPAPIGCLNTFLAMHPDWEYRLWRDTDLPEDLLRPELLRNARSLHGKSDYLRYELLYRFGGVYMDADAICLRPLDDLLECEFFCAYEHERICPGLVANGALGCVPGHPLARDLVDNARTGDPPWQVSGPAYLTGLLARHPDVVIHPSTHFWPIHHTETSLLGAIYADPTFGSLNEERRVQLYQRISNSYALQLWGTTNDIYGLLCEQQSPFATQIVASVHRGSGEAKLPDTVNPGANRL